MRPAVVINRGRDQKGVIFRIFSPVLYPIIYIPDNYEYDLLPLKLPVSLDMYLHLYSHYLVVNNRTLLI